MRMRYTGPVLAGLAVLAAVGCADAQGTPRAGGRLDGIYYGVKVNGMSNRAGPDFYTFLPDGRVLNGEPMEGLARPLQWEAECRYSLCGTYTVGAGGQVRIQWTPAANGTETLRIDPQGVLRSTQGSPRSWRPLRLLDGALEGRYGVRTYSGQGTATEITFTRDGRFRESGVLDYVNWDDLSPANRRALVAGGEGTYTLRRGTLELRYAGGLVAYLMVMVPPQGDAARELFINRSSYERMR